MGLGNILALVVLASLAGCGDSPRRESGNQLREATKKARQLSDRAHELLSNPKIQDDKTVIKTLDPEIITILDQAEKILTAAIQTNYEEKKSEEGEVSKADAAMAKQTLGMVRRLQGEFYFLSVGQEADKATQAAHESYTLLNELESQNTNILSYQKQLSHGQQKIKTMEAEATGIKTKAEKQIKRIDAAIKTFNVEIDQMEKRIVENNKVATSKKADAALATGAKSLALLEEALAAENQIHTDRYRIQKIRTDDLVKLQSELDEYKIQLQGANSKLATLADINKTRSGDTGTTSQKLAETEKSVSETSGKLGKLLNALGGACKKAHDLSKQAEDAYVKAERPLADAATLCESDKKAQVYADSADLKIGIAEVQLRMWHVREVVSKLNSHVETLWKGMYAEKPARPEISGGAEFLSKTQRALESAVVSYKEAVDLQKRAVSAADSKRKWRFQAGLATTYWNYALTLEKVGKDANAAKNNARNLLGDIEEGAASSGKTRSIQDLKKLIQGS